MILTDVKEQRDILLKAAFALDTLRTGCMSDANERICNVLKGFDDLARSYRHVGPAHEEDEYMESAWNRLKELLEKVYD